MSRRDAALASVALVALVFAAFQPALSAEFQTHWDDNYNLLSNERFRGFAPDNLRWMATGFLLGHWHPLTWLSFAFDHALHGMDPAGYHLTNVVLHAACAVLVFFVSRAVLRAAGSPAAERVLPSLAVAALFAVHPLRVESVAWITERRDVLSGAFLLGSVLAWMRLRADGARAFYWIALALFAGSLMSKAWGLTLPAVLLVLDAWPLRRFGREPLSRLLLEKAPFALLALGAAVLAFRAQAASGAMDYAAGFSPAQKAAQACFGLCYYVARTVWPADLLPVYALDTALDPGDLRFVLSFVGVAAAAIACVALRRRAPALAAACAVYAIVVSPVLGLTQSGVQLVADRYSFLATIPLALLLAPPIGALQRRASTAAAGGVVAVLALVLIVATRSYAKVWHDSRTLFTYASETDPTEWYPWNELGTMAFQDGDVPRALTLYDRAIACDDRAWFAYEKRGIARMNVGDTDGAIADYGRAIELYPHSPIAFVNRGGLRMQARDYAGARDDFERALDADPDNEGAWLMLGNARLRLDDAPGAIEALDRAIELAGEGSPVAPQAERLLDEARAR